MTLPFLEKYITPQAVLELLIHYRCKEAERIQRVLVVDNIAVSNGHREDVTKSKQEIYNLFPPRRQWVHAGYDRRKNLTQIDKNERNLLLTVLRESKREEPHPEWYARLTARVNMIVKAALTGNHLFTKPNVTVIEKKRNETDKTIECRPICLFKTLEERIYASLYNRVFTNLFDPLFYENSIAFRVPQKDDPQMLHLKAVSKIKAFRKAHPGNLCVAECDMKKFYDTLDHDVIKKCFSQMLRWKKQERVITNEEARILKNVIFTYVNCYNFYYDVYRYNKKPSHPIWKHIANGEKYKKSIKWILDEIEEKRKSGKWPYRTPRHERYQLGVPQGGALSGIIANVMMHFTDIKLRKYWENDDDFLYIRFCDDMIMMGAEQNKVKAAFKHYAKVIKKNHLYMHPEERFAELKMKGFWDGKTRAPYLWGAPAKDVMPWITFVGYDLNWEGETRIRKSSLKKEIKKQFEKRIEIEHLLGGKNGRNPQWVKHFIDNSVHKRLVGMSVGRVPIWDYKDFDNNYSWAKAFTELTDNPWSREQLRLLDWHRNLMMKRLSRFLLKLNYSDVKPSDKKAQREAVWYFGKPFSYFGQVLKKWD